MKDRAGPRSSDGGRGCGVGGWVGLIDTWVGGERGPQCMMPRPVSSGPSAPTRTLRAGCKIREIQDDLGSIVFA